MKKSQKIVLLLLLIMATAVGLAQSPPHPNGGNAPGSGSTPVGGGATLGGGLIILISLGLGYGARKIYEVRRKTLE